MFKKNLIINNIPLKKPENIFELFSQINIFLINLENEISGGLTFINFDYELEKIIRTLNIQFPDKEVLYGLIQNLFQNINFANSRYGNQSPYISFTIGIVENKKQALITEIILDVLKKGTNNNKPYIFPNIHFRVKSGINANKKDPYYYLLEKSIETTSHQMNPTYLLCDSDMNKNINPLYIHTVGCRSRLLETKNGEKYGIGRINIGSVSLNLPNIAMSNKDIEKTFEEIKYLMDKSVQILIKKQDILKENNLKYSPILKNNNLLYPFNKNIIDSLEEGSLAIGFIGFYEFSNILAKNKNLEYKYKLIEKTLNFMNNECKNLSKKYNKIVTLLGSSGEGISYYFPINDIKLGYLNEYKNLLKKKFYTNSFHVYVGELIDPIQKITLEGPMHKYCNGGISYIEVSHVKKI